MPSETLHDFAPDDERRSVIAECMETYDVARSFVTQRSCESATTRRLHELEPAQMPPSTEVVGCVLPRLAIGLTRAGSVAGVFGHCVRT